MQNVRKINKAGLHRSEIKDSYNWLEFRIALSVKQFEKLRNTLHITCYIDKIRFCAISLERHVMIISSKIPYFDKGNK